MNSLFKISLFQILLLLFFNSNSQSDVLNKNLSVFTDRDYCVSGDTVWFKVHLTNKTGIEGNIIRIQLETATKNLISVIAKETENGWAEGYIPVPDSLSTGQCFITAFLNEQRDEENLQIDSKSIMVYNRFENRISEINLLSTGTKLIPYNSGSPVEVRTSKDVYNTREEVEVTFRAETEFLLAVVKASLVDPLAKEIGGNYRFGFVNSESNIPDFVEKDGILISGQVTDNNGTAVSGVLVVLSITGDPPYFDYYFTEEGYFHFFLKDAFGKARIVLQVISDNETIYNIQTVKNYLYRNDNIVLNSKILTQEQTDFVEKITHAFFLHKVFNPVLAVEPDTFEFPARFSVPFYGLPTKRVIPDEFIDLPDFQEISRELLPGLQYRNRNDEIIFRMINLNQHSFFDDEPLRLINGIPVFRNKLFAGLKSTDISFIDIVQNERVFGDLKINGVLSVSLVDKSNFWMNQVPGIFEFGVDCLQPDRNPSYLDSIVQNNNLPDIRQTYLWEKMDDPENEFRFQLSDLKGDVEISLEGINVDGSLFKTSKIITVK